MSTQPTEYIKRSQKIPHEVVPGGGGGYSRCNAYGGSSLLMLYSSLILPYLNYGILAWGNTYQTFLDRLLLLQKRSLRTICNSAFRSHTDSLFFNNKILKIYDLFLFQLGQFMYNYNNNSLPHIFDTMFPKNQ